MHHFLGQAIVQRKKWGEGRRCMKGESISQSLSITSQINALEYVCKGDTVVELCEGISQPCALLWIASSREWCGFPWILVHGGEDGKRAFSP